MFVSCRRRTVDAVSTRARVTAAFSAAMAVLLALGGSALYLRIGATLQASADRALRSRADDVVALVRRADDGLANPDPPNRGSLTEQADRLTQVLDARGGVVAAPPALRGAALLTAAERARALRGTIVLDHRRSPGESDRVRLLATPVTAQGRRLIVVVGASQEANGEAQAAIGRLLLVGGPIALLLASLSGYGAAAGALRPVESMRRRAQEIQAGRPGRRLPVTGSGDELARLGMTLNAMLERLEGALEHERRFVADASHELRSPLTILQAELDLALRAGRDADALRDAVVSAAEEAARLSRLAEDLLVIARADDGRLPIRVQELDLADEAALLVKRFGGQASSLGVELTVSVPGGLRVGADRLRLAQALGNLVDNALRHGAHAVELAAEARGGVVAIHVRDDGAGFPEPFLPAAFDRFSRADPARARGGAGLGLAIVGAIAQAHGGRAVARNRQAGGADVWIELPARDGAAC